MNTTTAQFNLRPTSQEIQEMGEKAELEMMERSRAWCVDCETWILKSSNEIFEHDDGYHCTTCKPVWELESYEEWKADLSRDHE